MISANKTAELVIPIHLDKADISASVYLRAIRTPFFWLFPLWVIVMVVFFLSSYFHTSRLYAWVWGLIAGPISLFFLLQRSSASIAKQASTLAPMTLTFSAYGITAEFQNGTSKANWSLVKGARETGHYFFIDMQRRSFHLIPKRLLTDEQAAHLREILRANITKNVHLSR